MHSWPLVGRDNELRRVEDAMARRRGVLLAGPAGAGKTRLIEAVIEAAEKRGLAVVNVVASRSSESIPLGCMSALLASGDEVDEGAAGLVRVRRAIERIAHGAPVMLTLDDAHWLDGASAALVHQLVAGGDIVAVASVRNDEQIPAPVTALWKDALLERIELDPLDLESIVALLERVLGGQVQRVSALRLAERCRGNALFLRELLDEALRLELVGQQDGVWVIGDPPAHSARIAELVADRLHDLDPSAREALEIVALGEPVGLDVICRLTDAASVEQLEHRRLATLVVDGRRHEVRLNHPVHGDVVRARMPELRRRRLLAALADDLETTGTRRQGDRTRLAVLRLDAGGEPDVEMLRTAAWEAFAANGWPIAERLARAAHDASPAFGTAELLARVLFEQGKYDDEQDILTEAVGLAGSETEKSLVAVARAGGLFWGLGDIEGMRRVLSEAETQVTDSDVFWEVRGSRALFESQSGDHRTALALLADCPDPLTLGVRAHAQIALARAFALPGVGRGDDAIAMIDEAISRRSTDARLLTIYTAGLLDAARAVALADLGQLDAGEAVAERGYDTALRSGQTGTQGFFALGRAWINLQRGQLAEALRYYREASANFRAQSHRGPTRWALAGVLFASALARDREVVAAAEQALDDLGPHPAGLADVALGRARAWAALASDDPALARQRLDDATELARSRGLPGEEAACLHDRVRIGDAAQVVERLAELADHCAGEFVPTMAQHALGLVAGDVDALDDVSERFATMGFLLKAAEAAMGASEAAARSGDQRRASRLAQHAAEFAGRCQTPATPLLTSPAGPVPLTNREREVALLAAAGLPSRIIGERLYLSARTVDNHLARIYTKLGINSRSELPAALG